MAKNTKQKKKGKQKNNRQMRRTVMGTLSALFMISAIIVALIPTPKSKAATDMPDNEDIPAATANTDTAFPDYTNASNFTVYSSIDGKFRVSYGIHGGSYTGVMVYYNKNEMVSGGSLTIPEMMGAALYNPDNRQFIAVNDRNLPLYYQSRAEQTNPYVEAIYTLCSSTNQADWDGQVLYTMENEPRDEYVMVSDNSLLPNPIVSNQLMIPVEYIGSTRYDVDIARVNRFRDNDGIFVTGDNEGVFEGATNFSSLTIPNGIKAVGDRAFAGCQMQSVFIDNGTSIIGNYAFNNCNQLSSLTLTEPSLLREIGDRAFEGCTYLTNLKIPDQVQKLGNYCFKDCTNLSAINIYGLNNDGNTSLTTIGNGLFYNCRALDQVVFPDRVSNMAEVEYTCYNCQAMTSLGLPKEASGVFKANNVKGCQQLQTVRCVSNNLSFECPTGGPHDENSVPENCTFGKTNLGYNSPFVDEYEISDEFCIISYKNSAAFNYAQAHNLAFGYLDADCPGWFEKVVDGNVFCVDENNQLVRFNKNNGSGNNVIIPDNIGKYHVNTIKANTFQNNTDIEYLYIPSSVQTIEDDAFRGCVNLKTVQFDDADSIQYLGQNAFKTDVSNVQLDRDGDGKTDSDYVGLKFIGAINESNLPYQYAIDIANNYNSAEAPTQYITYASKFPENMQIVLDVTKDENTGAVTSAVPTLVGVPNEKQLQGLESYSISTYTGDSEYVKTKTQENDIVASANRKYQNNLLYPNSPMTLTEEEQAVIDAVYHVHVPAGVRAMKEDLFKDNDSVESVIFETIESVPNDTFKGCDNLKTFIMGSSQNPNGEKLGDHVFENCPKLDNVQLPATLTEMGELPFKDCLSLMDVDFDNSPYFTCDEAIIYQLGPDGKKEKVVECLQARGVNVGSSKLSQSEMEGIKEIAKGAFQNCTGIKEAYLDTSEIDTVPESCFDGATQLTYVSLPTTCKKIKKYAFRNTALSTAYIPANVSSIDDLAFIKGNPDTDSFDGYLQGLTVQCEENSTAHWYCDDKDGITPEFYVPEYTVEFIDYDNYVLKTQKVKKGASAEAPRVFRQGYVLTGWSKEFDRVTEDIQTQAQYVESNAPDIDGYYSVVFQDFDGLYKWDTQYLKPGETPAMPGVTPSRKGYIFSYWEPSNFTNIQVTSNMIVKAYYILDEDYKDEPESVDPDTKKNRYKVSFVDYDGKEIDSQIVLEGNCPNPSTVEPVRRGYTFTTWSPSNYAEVPVTGNMTVKALYKKGAAEVGGVVGGGTTSSESSTPSTGGNTSSSKPSSSKPSSNSSGTTNEKDNTNSNSNTTSSNRNPVGSSVSGNSASRPATNKKNTGTRVETTKSGLSNRDLITASVAGSNDNFVVKITDSEEAKQAIEAALLKEYGSLDDLKFFAMDISLYDSTGTTKIMDTTGLTVTITMPLPDALAGYAGNNKAGSVKNGDFEKLASRLITIDHVPCISFEAKHFSPYTIYVETNNLTQGISDATPKTGDGIHPKWFLAIGLALLSILMFLGKGSKNRVVKVV